VAMPFLIPPSPSARYVRRPLPIQIVVMRRGKLGAHVVVAGSAKVGCEPVIASPPEEVR
jgi:hypothetical protein